jgi:voltage-gated potassium channel
MPGKFIGRTYGELFDYYLDRNRSILIGVLENTGNFYSRKKEAIKEAQKTPDISKLVDNLKDVKQLIHNMPVINPNPEYVVSMHTKAIIIEGRTAKKRKQPRKEKNHADL